MLNSQWKSVGAAQLTPAANIPTMLTFEEEQMLFYYASNAQGVGDILDLGCHLGGSTARLMLGAAKGDFSKEIRAYDRFIFGENARVKLEKHGREFKETGLETVRSLLAQLPHDVMLCEGDLFDAKPYDRDIEILFIDIAKSTDALDHIAQNFYPKLIAGPSVIIQQDYQHFSCPWIIAHCEIWADKFTYIGHTAENSVIFQHVAEFTPDDIQNRLMSRYSDEEIIEFMHKARARFTDTTLVFAIEKSIHKVNHKGFQRSVF